MVCPAVSSWDDMVDVEVARLEMLLASIAVAALLAVEALLVLWRVVSRDGS